MSKACAVRRWLQAAVEREREPRNLIGLSLFRVLVGVAVLSEFLLVYGQRAYLFGNRGLVPYAAYLDQISHFSLYWYARSDWVFELIYHGSVLVVLLWTLGYATRWLTPLVFYCWTSFTDRGPPIWDGGDNLMAILLVFAWFADLGAHFSPGRAGAGTKGPRLVQRVPALAIFHNTALRAFGIQVCIVYFVAGIMKARGHGWLDGSALYASWADQQFGWPGVTDRIAQNKALLSLIAPLTIAFQISFPFFFALNRRSRVFILVVAMSFHLGIALLMGLLSFATFFIAAELALISDAEYRGAARLLRNRFQRENGRFVLSRPRHVKDGGVV
jgi:hypothetical protein